MRTDLVRKWNNNQLNLVWVRKMKNENYLKFENFITFLGVFILNTVFIQGQTKYDTINVYKMFEVKQEIAKDIDKEFNLLFQGHNTKVAQIILQNGNRLKPHSAEETILVQCISGTGELFIENKRIKEKILLTPGIVVSIEPNILHDIIGTPTISVLLTMFKNTK